jgi:hypothetical protein
LVFALAALACDAERAVVPNALLGRWVCEDARYVGRSLEISQRALIFASGPTQSENFAVRGVSTLDLPTGETRVAIHYGNEAALDLTLDLQLRQTTPPSLRIGERPERWKLAPRSGASR